jgi:hypothetical protein
MCILLLQDYLVYFSKGEENILQSQKIGTVFNIKNKNLKIPKQTQTHAFIHESDFQFKKGLNI